MGYCPVLYWLIERFSSFGDIITNIAKKHTKLKMENDKDILSAFKEKKWGKNYEGEFIIYGYSFKGRRLFKRALEGFKDMMKKGVIGEMRGIKYKVLDTRWSEFLVQLEGKTCLYRRSLKKILLMLLLSVMMDK